MTMSSTKPWPLGVLVAAWAALAVLLGAVGVFSNQPDRPPLALLMAVALPPIVFGLAYRSSAGLRAQVLGLDLARITAMQAWRVIGGMFLVLLALGQLPGTFAWPAGVGDLIVGVYAPFVALKVARGAPGWHRHVTSLNVLGLLDFAGAIGGGVLSGSSPIGLLRGPVSTDVMLTLPLSLIPTFGVPFWTILHIISLLQVRRPLGVTGRAPVGGLVLTLVVTCAPALIACAGCGSASMARSGAPAPSQGVPSWVSRGMPGAGQAALAPLVGSWRVELSIHGAMGRSPDLPPIVSHDIRTTRVWVADGHYLEDTTEGTVDGQPYWRRGWLGYSNIDRRFEWVTIAPRVPMMIYLGEPGSGARMPIDVSGVFTDQGVVSEQTVGQPVAQRTVFRIESDDLHVSELYFTPPGGKEQLALRFVYTRAPNTHAGATP